MWKIYECFAGVYGTKKKSENVAFWNCMKKKTKAGTCLATHALLHISKDTTINKKDVFAIYYGYYC